MYNFINDNSEKFVESFDKKSVSNYLDILKNPDQKKFKSFYGMNVARLSSDYYEKYFEILDSKKVDGKEIGKKPEKMTDDAILVAEYLGQSSLTKDDKPKIYFSFATKLLHTINQDCPIYDSRLADFYFLPYILESDTEKKLEMYREQYDFLISEYKRIENENLLKPTLELFEEEIEGFGEISLTKKIDFILWHVSSELRKGFLLKNSGKYK